MRIPFGLHRRIPRVRRVLELLAQTTAERDRLLAERDQLRNTLAELTRRQTFADAELTHAQQTNTQLEGALRERVAGEHPLLYGNVDAIMGETARRIWSLLRPMDPVGKDFVRKGRPHDGGYLMVDHQLHNAVAYSLGINDDVSWDLDMAALGCEIYQYDHTVDRLPVEHPRFHWFKKGIAASASTDGQFDCLDSLIACNGHAGRTDLILKMDIEGFEWETFEAMSEKTLRQFSQIVLEVHSLVLGGSKLQSRIARVLEKLYRSHQPVHVHANNHGFVGFVGGVMMPDTMELTYVRRADHQFTLCHRMFPSSFDMRCRRDVPDFFLGALGALPEPEVETVSC
ncbi:class I SAM-dependent methyltransferase [Paraburkholderia tropica]|uniref:FkbM family methyltransferase n=1 Tax=Paraburkholderia tropica TaxID=92647 RepID=UPI002AB7BD46|nr:FkbM family methyltransferase [Paraburkholderia tropica]